LFRSIFAIEQEGRLLAVRRRGFNGRLRLRDGRRKSCGLLLDRFIVRRHDGFGRGLFMGRLVDRQFLVVLNVQIFIAARRFMIEGAVFGRKTIVMFGKLQKAFGQNTIGRLYFPRRILVTLVKLQGGAAHLALGAVALDLAVEQVLRPPHATIVAVPMIIVVGVGAIVGAAHIPASGITPTLTARVWTLSHE